MPIDLESLKSKIHLTASADELNRVYDRVKQAIADLSADERNSFLLIAEREILGARGHRVTVKFGHSNAVNNPPCIVCRRPVDATDWSLRIISRWENSQLWFTWHDFCIEHNELEFDYDVLTGQVVSPIGFI